MKRIVSVLKEQSGRMTATGLLVTIMVTMVLGAFLSTGLVNAGTTYMDVNDTITASCPGMESEHLITFTHFSSMSANDTITVLLEDHSASPFGAADVLLNIGGALTVVNGAPGDTQVGLATSSAGGDLTLTFTLGTNVGLASVSAGEAGTLTLDGPNLVTNPAAVGSYMVNVTFNTASGQDEHGDGWVATVDCVELETTVESFFEFEVNDGQLASSSDGIGANAVVTNGVGDFGTLASGTPYTLSTRLDACTNAFDGFAVTMQMNHGFISSNSADIDQFIDGAPSADAAWVSPTAVSTQENTYGHIGYHTSDLDAADANTAGQWFGIAANGAAGAKEIFFNNEGAGCTTELGGTASASQGDNYALIHYRTEISDLQEPGEYEQQIMYIGTAVF